MRGATMRGATMRGATMRGATMRGATMRGDTGMRFVHSFDDLRRFLAQYPDTNEGVSQAALALWGYNLWTRLAILRRLVDFFHQADVRTQRDLLRWAEASSYERDFKGKVKGLGPAVYNWLIMRQGVKSVNADVHVHRFVEAPLRRKVNDDVIVQELTAIAHQLGLKAYELDRRIWEYQRSLSK